MLSKRGLSCKYKLQVPNTSSAHTASYFEALHLKHHDVPFSHQGLKFTPWCLDYWVDPLDPDLAVLTIGDTGGQVVDESA